MEGRLGLPTRLRRNGAKLHEFGVVGLHSHSLPYFLCDSVRRCRIDILGVEVQASD